MYNENDLNKLIADVTSEFTAHLAKAEESFNAKPKEEPEKDESKEPKKEEASEDKGEKPESKEEPKAEGEQPEAKEAAPKEGEKKPAEERKEGESEEHGYDNEDLEHLGKMYGSMSKAELRVHHDEIRKCMDAHGAAQAAPAAQPQPEAMAKSEKDVAIAPTEEVSLLKSELEAAKAEKEDLKKNLDAVSAFLTKFVEKTVPAGKAITSLDIIAKSSEVQEKTLSKSEIDAKLMAKAKESSLSKSDRDAINSYYCGSKNVELVKHLLK